MTSAESVEVISSAEAEARKRRERILQLKRKAQGVVENKSEATSISETMT